MKRFAITVLCGLLLATGVAANAAEFTRIYLANDDHTDYMWTADAETYNAVFVDMLDYYLRLADETKDNPSPYRSRFNADGSYWLWQYERRKSPADFERLMARLKDGTISAPMNTLVSCYGGQPLEAVLRGMYYAGRLERRHGLRFSMAVAMENQTLPLGLASLWAGSGAHYTWKGVCGCAGCRTSACSPAMFLRPATRCLKSRAAPARHRPTPPLSSAPDNATLENSRIKLTVDPDGAIASLIDKARPEHELATTIGGLKLNDFAANDTNGTAIVVENSGPVSVTLKCVSGAGRQHTTRITLFRDSDRVAIQNEITENFGDVRHWAFSFNLSSPDVHTEEVGAVIRAKTKSNGGDYADTHARYDYVTLNHFADITDGANTRGVTLANADCAFARLGQSTATNLDTATPQINVLAGGQVDGSWLGIRGQNGATHFLQRFALRPHGAYDQTAAMKFALESQNPLVTAPIIGITNSPYPATNYFPPHHQPSQRPALGAQTA